MSNKDNKYNLLPYISLGGFILSSIGTVDVAKNTSNFDLIAPLFISSVGFLMAFVISATNSIRKEIGKFDNDQFENSQVWDIYKYTIKINNGLKEEVTVIMPDRSSYDYIITKDKDSYETLNRIYSISKNYNKNLHIITSRDSEGDYISFFFTGEIKPYYIYVITDNEYFNLDGILYNYKPLLLVKDESGKTFGYNPNTGFTKIKDNGAKEYVKISEEINGKSLNKYDLYNNRPDNIVKDYKMLPIGFVNKYEGRLIYSVMGSDNSEMGKKKLVEILSK
ncbi:hypothetical protein YN1_1470 [Nanoarchaeota archaeon]